MSSVRKQKVHMSNPLESPNPEVNFNMYKEIQLDLKERIKELELQNKQI